MEQYKSGEALLRCCLLCIDEYITFQWNNISQVKLCLDVVSWKGKRKNRRDFIGEDNVNLNDVIACVAVVLRLCCLRFLHPRSTRHSQHVHELAVLGLWKSFREQISQVNFCWYIL
jgi:hypothetical protein